MHKNKKIKKIFWFYQNSTLPTTNYQLPTSSGFTLIETLVAIGVLLLSITGPLLLAKQGISTSVTVKNQLIASYLAQEGIEYIKNIRDQNFIVGPPAKMDSGLPVCNGNSYCKIAPFVSGVSTCGGPGVDCEVLRKNATDGRYGYLATWEPTIFARNISIDKSRLPEEITVIVEVKWTQGVVTKNIVLTETLFALKDM